MKKELIKTVNNLLEKNPTLTQGMFDYEEGEYITDEEEYLKAFIKWIKNQDK